MDGEEEEEKLDEDKEKKRKKGERDEEEKVKVFLPAILDPPLPGVVGCQPKIKEQCVGNEKNEVVDKGQIKKHHCHLK
jgi:hypothetical protein